MSLKKSIHPLDHPVMRSGGFRPWIRREAGSEDLKSLGTQTELGEFAEPLARHAEVLPLLIVVAVQRHIVGFVSDAKVRKHTPVFGNVREDLVPNRFADRVSIISIDLHSGRVVAHLPDSPFAHDIQTLDDLERGLPTPDIGVKFEVLRA